MVHEPKEYWFQIRSIYFPYDVEVDVYGKTKIYNRIYLEGPGLSAWIIFRSGREELLEFSLKLGVLEDSLLLGVSADGSRGVSQSIGTTPVSTGI